MLNKENEAMNLKQENVTCDRCNKEAKQMMVGAGYKYCKECYDKVSDSVNVPILKPLLNKGIDHIGVCVVFFCHDGNGNVLMGLRSERCRDESGKWDIGAGVLEFGEDPIDCLEREIKEEYETVIKAASFLGIRNVVRTLPDGTPTHWIAIDFKVYVDRSMLAIGEPEKIDAIDWFTYEEIKENFAICHSQFEKFVENYEEDLF